jgi:STE24 endopeptidase
MVQTILIVFLVLFAAHLSLEVGLALANLRRAREAGDGVPPQLAPHIPAEVARRSREYTLARGRLEVMEQLYDAGLTLAVLFSGLLPAWDGWLGGLGVAGAHRFVVFLVGLFALLGLAGLPFGLHRTFRLEARFGFNRTTLRLWLLDRLKGLALAAAVGLPVLYGAHAFMVYTGAAWWLWLFAFLAALQLGLLWLYPTLIAPLFNRFTPLPAGELRERLEALAARAGFRTQGIYVVDASRRSGHSNAYFAGLIRPRIVLFDTLVQRMPADETLAVLAHEMGHYRARHIHRMLAVNLALLLAGLYLLSVLAAWPALFQGFGFAAPSFHAAVALAMLGGGAFTFLLTPLATALSRRHEFQADAYSVALLRLPEALKSALVRMSGENLTNLNPHPWYSAYHYSHPTLPERLAAIDRAAQALTPVPAGD